MLAGKIMAGELRNSEGVFRVDFPPRRIQIKEQYYDFFLCSDAHQAIRKNNRAEVSKEIILLPENVRPRTINLTMVARMQCSCELKRAIHIVANRLYEVKDTLTRFHSQLFSFYYFYSPNSRYTQLKNHR
jgi:hypothetical protein